ncbi:MAG: hypothetical protein O2794_03830 [bacterium]|nr:hypothetical protein [bacterium]
MRIYFGHPLNTYGTPLEAKLLEAIQNRFEKVEIVNPNCSEHQAGYLVNGMQYFVELVGTCYGGVFLPFGDGAWSAGVHLEAETLWRRHRHVWVITFDGRIMEIRNFAGVRGLSRQETSERLYLPPPGSNGFRPYK